MLLLFFLSLSPNSNSTDSTQYTYNTHKIMGCVAGYVAITFCIVYDVAHTKIFNNISCVPPPPKEIVSLNCSEMQPFLCYEVLRLLFCNILQFTIIINDFYVVTRLNQMCNVFLYINV